MRRYLKNLFMLFSIGIIFLRILNLLYEFEIEDFNL